MREPDNQQRFLIESCDVRGQLVQLDQTWLDATARTDYPEHVQIALGEAFVATTLLAGTIKFSGKMTLQVRGTGAVHLLVVQITDDGKMRGLARWHDEPASGELNTVFGEDARMTITIETARQGEPYQGIVALEGESLADALRTYFANSEQLQTELYLSVSDETAAGMLLQKLPAEEHRAEDADGWQRAVTLAATITPDELLQRGAQSLLNLIFHGERVRLFNAEKMSFDCSCSRERTNGMLLSLGESEVQSILDEQGVVEITCEFCDSHYRYDSIDASALFKANVVSDESETRH
jgi:molecular chaperone Hsp33